MDDQKEKVEAQLCEYVDGVLVGSERQAIEDYLRDNPSLREMIDQLIAHRGAVASLPREKAPVFMGEDVYGQLERQALLAGGLEEPEPPVLRIHRWPQLLSAAAIIFLALGLGMFVYFILPPKNPAMPIAQTTATLPAAPAANDSLSVAAVIEETLAERETAEREVLARDGAATDSFILTRMRGALDAPAALAAGLDAVAEPPSTPQDQTLVITVTADDASQANQELVQFLSTNGIAWSAQSNQLVPRAAFFRAEPPIEPADESRLRGLTMELVKKESFDDSTAAGRIALKPNPVEPAALPATDVEKQIEMDLAARPQPAPSRRARIAQLDKSADVNDAKAAAFGRADANQPLEIESRLAVQPSGVAGRVILAKNISARQLHELTRSLSRPERVRLAEVRSEPAGPAAPTTTILGAPLAVIAEAATASEFSLRADRSASSSTPGAAGMPPAEHSPTLTLGADLRFLAPTSGSDKQLSLVPQQFSSLLSFGSYSFSLTDGREDGARLTGRINLTPSTSFFGPLGALGQIGLGLEERPFNCVFIVKEAAPVPSEALKAKAAEE